MINRRDFIKSAAIGSFFLGTGKSESNETTKKIILCFDGNKRPEKWREVIDLGEELKDLRGYASFSVYGNSCFWYQNAKGQSEIGWGGSKEEIDERIELTQRAIDLGHEFGNHTVRHLHGGKWSYNQWAEELGEFDEHAAEVLKNKDGEPYHCLGYRAPFLEWNDEMLKALSDLGYLYDISPPGDFVRESMGIKVIGVPMYTRDNGSKILGMDYNWHFHKVSDKELERMLEREYKSKNPLIVSLHFSDWQHGEKNYFEVVRDFMISKAKSEEVEFPSMIDYYRSLKVEE